MVKLTTVAYVIGIVQLAALLVWYQPRKVEIQSQDCHMPVLFHNWFTTITDQPEFWDPYLEQFHISSASFIWMQVALVVCLLIDHVIGIEMYLLVIVGHVVKNFAKSFIQSPRGFWFCEEGKAAHCGSGYSLPSGHSMMSLLVSMFLLWKFRKPWMILVCLFMEIFIVFEIVYLGTHTRMDVIIGFSFAIAYFSCYLALKENFGHLFHSISQELVLITVLFSAVAVYILELYEEHIDSITTHPIEWQENYQNYCSLPEGTAAIKMRNSSAFEKTGLILGITIGFYCWRKLFSPASDGSTPMWKKIVRTVIFTYVFTNSKKILAMLLGPLSGNWKYLPFLVQPLLFLIFFPLIAQLFGFGNFWRSKRKEKEGKSLEKDKEKEKPKKENGKTSEKSKDKLQVERSKLQNGGVEAKPSNGKPQDGKNFQKNKGEKSNEKLKVEKSKNKIQETKEKSKENSKEGLKANKKEKI